MPTSAQSIIKRADDISQDKTSVQWGIDEKVRWLNDGLREIAILRPDLFATHAATPLVVGTRQTIPAAGFRLIDVVNNTNGGKEAIRQIPRRDLDEQVPGWHGMTPASTIKHFTFDPRDPRAFYVYPPAVTSTQVNLVYARYPQPVAEPSAGGTVANVVGDVDAPDIAMGALLDYLLYRIYSKDSEYAGNAERARAHYGAFSGALGADVNATKIVAPEANNPGASNQ